MLNWVGGHTSNQQISSFNFLFENLREEGSYLVEDTHTSYHPNFQDRSDGLTFTEYAKSLSDELNDWYRVNDYKIYKNNVNKVKVSYLAKKLYSVAFYNSIVIFEKKNNKTPKNEIQ